MVLSIGCLAWAPSAAFEAYKYVDSNGTVHFTDRPPHDGYQLIQLKRKKAKMSRINFRDKEANRKRFSGKIAEVASRYQVPEALLHAVITIESVYDPNAISRAGAVGWAGLSGRAMVSVMGVPLHVLRMPHPRAGAPLPRPGRSARTGGG